MKIFLLLTLISTSLFAQRTSTIDADCLRIKDGTCIDKLELGYLDGLSGSIPTSLSGKVSTTGNESISGVKTFTDQLIASSTTKGFIPCPVMTETQRNAISSPVLGNCITNSTTASLNIYDGSNWKSAGGGLSSWVTARAYIVGDIVIESNRIYQCLIAHTSGTFATDLASVRWLRVSTDVSSATGVLPLVNGGTDKALTSVLGGVVYTDANSMEVLGAGTSGQELQSNGGAAPTWVNKSISGKAQNLTAVTMEELQVPNNLLTITAAGKFLSESGNKNILTDPSFEHSTRFGDGGSPWVVGAGSTSQETTIIIDGKKSAKIELTAETLSVVQSSTLYASAFADGVQGLASCRIESTAVIKMCSVSAGVVSTTNCVNVNPDGKWGLYKIPFILGATSNGVSIASSGSVTGTVYIDDCFVGAVDLKQDINNIGPWTAYTPTYTGFGTVASSECFHRQNGTNRDVRCKLTAGTTTAVEARISLPLSDIADASKLPTTVSIIGKAVQNTFATTTFDESVLIEPSVSYMTFGLQTSSASGIVKTNGSNLVATGGTFSFFASYPATQLAGASSVYTANCGANCVDTFSAKVSSADAVSEENVDFINGNCTNATTGQGTCTFNSGIFTVTPNCIVTPVITGSTEVFISAQSSTAITYITYGSAGAAANSAVNISCQKQGADFSASRSIIGTFNEVVTSPGMSKPVRYQALFTNGSSAVCSSTPCTAQYFSRSATDLTMTRSGTGAYALSSANGLFAASSYVSCVITLTNANIYRLTALPVTNGSGALSAIGIDTQNRASAAVVDATLDVTCTGQAP